MIQFTKFIKSLLKTVSGNGGNVAPSYVDLNSNSLFKNMELLRSFDLRDGSIEDLTILVQDLIKGYLNRTVIFPKGGSLFRAIPYATKPTRLDQLSYPPDILARENRANRAGKQVLYCSTSKGTPIYEIRPTPGSYVALVQYNIEKDLEVAHIGFTHENLNRMNVDRGMPEWSLDNNILSKLEINSFLENYLAEEFTQVIGADDHHLYKLTIAIAELLTRHSHIFGLIYPSIATTGLRDNIVIDKSFLDIGGLSFDSVEWVKIINIDDDSIDTWVEDFACAVDRDRDKSVQWLGRQAIWDTPDGFRILESDGFQLIVGPDNRIVKKR